MSPSTSTQFRSRLNEERESYSEILRKRRRVALDIIERVLPDGRGRLAPFFDPERVEIDWRKLAQAEWSADETLTLQWLRSMWEEKMYVKSRGGFSCLFPRDHDMREAVFCALAVSNYTSHMLNDYSLRRYSGEKV